MRYLEPLFRPPAEAESFILQATHGCSWNTCTFCGMYRGRPFQVRPLQELLAEIEEARVYADEVRHVFVADGDALVLPMGHWEPILEALAVTFPRLRRVSAYATARNILEKTPEELHRLRGKGLSLLYIGPESGDDETLRRIGKGSSAVEHIEAARRAQAAGIDQSLMFLLGIGGRSRSEAHARASGRLATAMDPKYLSTLTLTVVPGTPLARQSAFELPDVRGLLQELRWFIEEATPSAAIFRSNHASNYLPIGGRLPRDRASILAAIDAALEGQVTLRPEWARGL
ncbi:MAG: Oxygen-independent coproporphyrinogen oxidase, Fe-S oxidoreductase [Holophagaceae bacterium]|nr:Oxygen-independent coproporphyrinogen oxidase, Fe-S oxidoreductase [Holophagaceae bacterium]